MPQMGSVKIFHINFVLIGCLMDLMRKVKPKFTKRQQRGEFFEFQE
jgi:hypothetical protein